MTASTESKESCEQTHATTANPSSTAEIANPSLTIESVQWLRFIAASLVVIYHIEVQLFRLDGVRRDDFGIGASGVDLFFVISGFIMVYITYGRQESFMSFMRRRILRVTPIYWVCTLAILTLIFIAPTLLHSTKLDITHVISSFFYVPYPHPVSNLYWPVLVPGWTLNYEMFFYLLFASMLWLPAGPRIVVVCSALALLVLARVLLTDEPRWVDFYGAPIVLEFAAGMAIGWLYFTRRSLSRGQIAAAALFGIFMFAAGVWAGIGEHESRVIFWGLGSAGVVLAVVFIEKAYGWPNVKLLRHLGDSSFSLYLSHLFVIAAAAVAIRQLAIFPWLGETGTRAVMLLVAFSVGSAIFVWIERPMHNKLKRWSRVRHPTAEDRAGERHG